LDWSLRIWATNWVLFETALRHQVGALRAETVVAAQNSEAEAFAKLADHGFITNDRGMFNCG
jgi:hypothetical protein